ncbi:MAG TPA: ATP-binding protein [Pirellulales bacterium]|nr:ATP-binding protein [Pirellulales bacterium]
MRDFEGLGIFYLGRPYDLDTRKTQPEPLLYDAKDLTTHAVCVGMTGSGKTGLCLALLEEAAIDGIPAIAIDPKGDLGNLLLTFPELRPDDFRPWLDPAAATRQQITVDQLAERTAEQWRTGLADWGQDPARIARFANAVERTIYTPGSSAGVPLAVLRSFAAPPKEILDDVDALRERIAGSVAGLLALMNIEADPLRSREHILIATLLEEAWRAGRGVDLNALIRQIQSPPIDRIGAVDVESFFPAKDRFALAMRLNNLLASPGFAGWMQGEPLDIQRLLYTPAGKPRLSILSIAHLSDAERMFFVTMLLNEIVAWMRTQSGTSSLRAILYMDEVFGFFPPSANPPSKTPMLTLLKQARAFGLGVVLATQNPVDLDYKGLANAGTWLVGRLQTERDKARLLDGLEGASASAGAKFDRARMQKILASLGDRVFLMNNVHEDEPVVFQSRWVLSFLRGPLSREQIHALIHPPGAKAATADAPGATVTATTSDAAPRPVLPPEIPEMFIPVGVAVPKGTTIVYRPGLCAAVRLHFVQPSNGIDVWRDQTVCLPVVDAVSDEIWSAAEVRADPLELESQAEAEARFAALPVELCRPKTFAQLAASLKNHLYRNQRLPLWKCAEFKETSKLGESEGDFRVRLAHRLNEQRDADVEKLRAAYAAKLAALDERKRKAEQRVEKEKSQVAHQKWQTMVTVGQSVLAALLGRKRISATTINRVGTSVRSLDRASRESQDVAHAEENVDAIQQQYTKLDAECQTKIEQLRQSANPERLELEQLDLQPRKSDLAVTKLVLAWTPWLAVAGGKLERGW